MACWITAGPEQKTDIVPRALREHDSQFYDIPLSLHNKQKKYELHFPRESELRRDCARETSVWIFPAC